MKHLLVACVGVVSLISFTRADAQDSYLRHSLESVAASPLFDQAEKDLITSLPELFTHAYVKQLYFGDTEQRALQPFVEKTSVHLAAFKPIKDKLAQLHKQALKQEEKDMVNFVHYLVTMVLDYLRTDCPLNTPSATRADAASIANACRLLLLELLDVTDEINANVNAIIGNITAPCT